MQTWRMNIEQTFSFEHNSTIPSFCLRDNSVPLHECSPFWEGIFIIFCIEKLPCLLFDVNMRILIGKTF